MASNCFDAPDSSRHCCFAYDPEEADLAGSTDMSSAAEFHRVAIKRTGHTSDLNNTDYIPILVTEELENAGAALHLGVG